MEYRLEVVVVPVTDVDRAKHFYADLLGFHVDVDHQVSEDIRIVQLTPEGSGCSVTIGTGLADMAPGSLKGLQLCVSDIVAAHAELTARGVPVGPIQHHDGKGFVDGKGDRWNAFVFFQDPDGNGWAIQESPTMQAAEADRGAAGDSDATPSGAMA